MREQALGRDQAPEHGPRDHRDPADVGERDERERDQDPEPGGVHRAEVVRVHPPGGTGDERRQGERHELDACDVDAGGCSGSLVRAYGEHLLAETAPAQVRDEEAQHDHDDDEEEAEHRARDACRPAHGTMRSSRVSSPPSVGCSTGEP